MFSKIFSIELWKILKINLLIVLVCVSIFRTSTFIRFVNTDCLWIRTVSINCVLISSFFDISELMFGNYIFMYVVVQQFLLHKLVQTPITSQYNVTLITFKNFVSSYVSEYLSLVFKKKPHYFKEYAFVKKIYFLFQHS